MNCELCDNNRLNVLKAYWAHNQNIPIDTIPPTVIIATSLANNSVEGSNVVIIASASNNVGVVGVQFKLDSTTNLGEEDTASVFSVNWNTLNTSNGTHILTSVARDAAGNQTTSTVVLVNMQNTIETSQSISAGSGGGSSSGLSSTAIIGFGNIVAQFIFTTEVQTISTPVLSNTTQASILNFIQQEKQYIKFGRSKINQSYQFHILLQVQFHSEVWYVDPSNGKRYYLINGEVAFQIMRFRSLGITNQDIRKIGIGEFD